MPLKETEEMILLPAGRFKVGRGPLGDGNAENIGLRVGLDEGGAVIEDGLISYEGLGDGCGSDEGLGDGCGSEEGLGDGCGSEEGLGEGASDCFMSEEGLGDGASVSDEGSGRVVDEGMGSEEGLDVGFMSYEGLGEGASVSDEGSGAVVEDGFISDEGSGLTGHIIISHAPAIPEARHILYMSWHAGKVESQHLGVAVGHISISHADATGADARHCL